MSGRPRRVPGIARRLLLALLPREMRAGAEGDFEEIWCRRLDRDGAFRARIGYWRDAVALLVRLGSDRLRNGRLTGRLARPGAAAGGSASWLDVKLGVRMLGKYPGLTLIGGLGMAVAIAIGVGFFSVAWHFFQPTLPLDEGDRLVALENWDVEVNNEERQALHDFELWRAEMETVQEVSAFRESTRNVIGDDGGVQTVIVAEMTASGFETARVPPLMGRYLVADDEAADAPPVLVIGHDVWQARFGGDPEVIGRQQRLGATSYTIVGVMPEGYGFPLNHSWWTPFKWRAIDWERGRGPYIYVWGRLAEGVTMEQAQAELTAIGERSATAWPDSHERLRPQVLSYTYPLTDIQDMTIWDLGATQFIATLLLVVVAMNVAVLSYARVATRRGEIAVRAALGASRSRIVFQLFVEALVLSSFAALIGLGLAHVGLTQVNVIMEEELGRTPFWGGFGLGSAAIPAILALTTLAAVIVGVIPGLQATGRGLKATLSQLGGGTGLRLGRTWTFLIVVQVAIAVCGLSIGTSMAWDQIAVLTVTPTFSQRDMVAVRMSMESDPPPGADPEAWLARADARFDELRNELRRRIEADSLTTEVTHASAIPGGGPGARVEIEGLELPADAALGHPIRTVQAAPDLFDALDVPLLAGELFPPEGSEETSGVVVSRAFVDQLLGGASSLGRRVRYTPVGDPDADDQPWYEIVGVVEDLFQSTMDPRDIDPTMYHPLAWEDAGNGFLLLRVRGELDAAGDRVREIAAALDPGLRVTTRDFEALNRQQQAAVLLIAMVITGVMLSVLLLAAAGVYALMSFAVTRQRREIGIRTALGALPHRLLATVFSRALVQLLIGVALGAALAMLVDGPDGVFSEGYARLLIPAVSLVMMLVGLIATLGPARRGLRVDPTEALRAE